MNFLKKTTLLPLILFFIFFSLHRAEAANGNPYDIKYQFIKKEDCIKVKIVLPVGVMPDSTLCRIKNPDSKGLAIKIKNDSLEYIETVNQLVDIEIYAIPCPKEGGVTFEIIENLERKSTDRKYIEYKHTTTTKYFVKTDKQIDFKDNVLPKLTVSQNSPDIKYVRFFTKP